MCLERSYEGTFQVCPGFHPHSPWWWEKKSTFQEAGTTFIALAYSSNTRFLTEPSHTGSIYCATFIGGRHHIGADNKINRVVNWWPGTEMWREIPFLLSSFGRKKAWTKNVYFAAVALSIFKEKHIQCKQYLDLMCTMKHVFNELCVILVQYIVNILCVC